jgi:hypothetical protein
MHKLKKQSENNLKILLSIEYLNEIKENEHGLLISIGRYLNNGTASARAMIIVYLATENH